MTDKHDKLLKEGRDRLDLCVDADRDNREEALNDLQFIAGEQWPTKVKQQRETDGRPILTINRMPQFLRQVTGDIRQANPAINVIPADSDASDEMAEVINGLIRNIEYQSDGSGVYESGAESAAACGMGNFRVLYKPNKRGENEIYLRSIRNPFAVYWDPLSKDPTRKDAQFCFILDRMDKDKYDKKYPKAGEEGFEATDVTNSQNYWVQGNTIVVAEYFYKEDGNVMWVKMSGNDVLEGPQQFHGSEIPVVAVMGEEMYVGERIVRSGVIRYAKDAQRLYNYWRSAQTELIGLQPKAPYKMTAKQLKGNEAYWNKANTSNLPYLLFNPDDQNPGAPQREQPPVPSSGMMNEIMLAADDMKATTGIYDAGLGDKGNETSGVAIRQRQMEGDISTSIYVDNLSKSIGQCGRIIVGLIPHIYDTTRVVRVLGEDGASALEELNVPYVSQTGIEYKNATDIGEYDIRIKTGPSYSTQRQESVENMMEFAKAFPDAAPLVGDLIARNMDWPGADELADRLASMLPPGISKKDEPPTPEEQQAMMAAQQQEQEQAQIQQMMQEAEIARAGSAAQEAQADAVKAQSDAEKSQLEVIEKQLEIAMNNGLLDEAIQEGVARALSALTPQGAF